MKSFLIWVIFTAIGGGIGYLLTDMIDLSPLLLVFAGLVLGSTAGITLNIHRNRDEFDIEEEEAEG